MDSSTTACLRQNKYHSAEPVTKSGCYWFSGNKATCYFSVLSQPAFLKLIFTLFRSCWLVLQDTYLCWNWTGRMRLAKPQLLGIYILRSTPFTPSAHMFRAVRRDERITSSTSASQRHTMSCPPKRNIEIRWVCASQLVWDSEFSLLLQPAFIGRDPRPDIVHDISIACPCDSWGPRGARLVC